MNLHHDGTLEPIHGVRVGERVHVEAGPLTGWYTVVEVFEHGCRIEEAQLIRGEN